MKKDIILNAAVIHNGISEVLQNHGDELSPDEISSLEQVKDDPFLLLKFTQYQKALDTRRKLKAKRKKKKSKK